MKINFLTVIFIIALAFSAASCNYEKENSKGELSVGDTFSMGNIEDEMIEWTVLSIEDGRALIISTHLIGEKQFDDGTKNVTWENCSLRSYLNDDFLCVAFNSEEQGLILDTELEGGITDKIFLLSNEEVNKYMSSNEVRVASYGNGREYDWWLRTLGHVPYYSAGACVDDNGEVNEDGNKSNNWSGVRPAMYIKV